MVKRRIKRVSKADKLKIIDMYEKGEPIAKICLEIGFSQTTIYKHLPKTKTEGEKEENNITTEQFDNFLTKKEENLTTSQPPVKPKEEPKRNTIEVKNSEEKVKNSTLIEGCQIMEHNEDIIREKAFKILHDETSLPFELELSEALKNNGGLNCKFNDDPTFKKRYFEYIKQRRNKMKKIS
jgi:transposase-like protein